jgi:PAS domain S-box-containing protein
METELAFSSNASQRAEPPLGLLEFHTGQFCLSRLHGLARAEFKEMAPRALAASPAAVMITDRNGIIEYVNEKFSALTGYAFDEVRGLTPSILRSGGTPRESFQEFWRTLLGGHDWHGEFRNRKKNGEIYWEFASIWPVTNDEGQIGHFLAIKSDITGRKAKVEAEQRVILASEEALAALDLLRESLCMCAWCHKVRDNNGHWVEFDSDVFQRAHIATNHGICPECKADQLRAISGGANLITGIDFKGEACAQKRRGINE